ncbi:probable indole-3-acetic acid-amido synthetase GH3.1 [Salvia miltiorrhiza]|uniref:probable indole-3-acetic acid-amido synthetase GH3.1 n=1 Tax=Salvia miltiorrhiza TaxID=226208 RepID=UPI0025ACCEAA|nr:probable indole-3-acetic acid-amido synthetase GH3.1 [Salvia miltiorrhiza]
MAGISSLSSPVNTPAHAKELELIEETTKNAYELQNYALAQILTQNAHTEYLKNFNLDGATDRKSFLSKVPMVTYDDLQPMIQRLVDGDRTPILCALPISEFLSSSGTSSGDPKLFPNHEEETNRRLLLCSLIRPILNKFVKGWEQGKGLYFMFVKPEARTRGGHPIQPGSTGMVRKRDAESRPHDPYYDFTSPTEAMFCTDPFQSMYTQMLCALYERQQVGRVGAQFALGLLRAIRFLQLNWQQLTRDIRTGSLSPNVTDPSIRECMTRVLRPNPALAGFIAQECVKGSWEGIIIRIWPNTKYIDVIITGSTAQYIPTLDYYSGGLPKISWIYGSPECFPAINLNPICNPSEISYTIMPNMAYLEFLPYLPNSDPVDLADVKIGQEYELVVTTYAGLYRYRTGDIIRVTGFHNSAPQFRFVKRRNAVLSVGADETDEVELQAASEKASRFLEEFGASVLDYTSYAEAGHYVVYVELLVKKSGESPSDEVMEKCCVVMEESLMMNWVYRRCRVEEKSIGALEIRVVKSGAFEEMVDYAVSRGASVNLYKVPRCLTVKPILEILQSRLLSTHFTPSIPQSIPTPTKL